MIKLKKVNDDKRELVQKMEWSEKFWKDKLVSLEKENSALAQKNEAYEIQLGKLKADCSNAESQYGSRISNMQKIRLGEAIKKAGNAEEEAKKKDAQTSDMSRQITYLMKSLEECKAVSENAKTAMAEKEQECAELKVLLTQQRDIIKQHEATIKDFHKKSVEGANQALNKWGTIQAKYEENVKS